MRCQGACGVLLAFVLAAAGSAGDDGPREPRLELRVSPRMSAARPPVAVLVVAQLRGGEDLEEYYCPGLEWDWGDGSRSFHESDCSPFEAGTRIERFFSARHVYREPGSYAVRVRLMRADAPIAVAGGTFMLHGGEFASQWE